MSTDGKDTACSSEKALNVSSVEDGDRDQCDDQICDKKRRKPTRKVCFPDEDQIVTQYFEPANPWQDVPQTTRAQLAAEYLECCRRHNTPPIETVLRQIREVPESALGGGCRAARLSLCECSLLGAAPADALEAVLRRVQFRRLEVHDAAIDDEGAEALFDMVEYYESATVLAINGPRAFGIRGWQAASRMIKKSCHLAELEVTNHPLEAGHAPVLARALHAHTCRLRVLCLQRTLLAGDSLLCLVIALKSNNSVRELRLGDNQLGVSDALQLASLLRYNSRLQLLDLSNNQIQDAGCAHLADALAEQAAHTPPSAAASPLSPHHCPLTGYESRGLSFLVLWNNQLTRNCAHHLSRALLSTSLCVLNVGRNALGSEVVRALSGGCLHSLGLQCARLGPDAAFSRLVCDTQLQRLDLRDNKLGSAGLRAILAALRERSTLTQIDLDDPPESTTTLTPEDSETAAVSRLTREIRSFLRDKEPAATSPERRVHRKISLTCHTTCIPRAMQGAAGAEEPRATSAGARLRSPLPSPAGSPIPNTHSRFSVTRVTPEREVSSPSGHPSPNSPTPPSSRFRVVQVAEPPQIHVHSAEPRRSSSRFSVTRNYDIIYNPNNPHPTSEASTNTDKPPTSSHTAKHVRSDTKVDAASANDKDSSAVGDKSVKSESKVNLVHRSDADDKVKSVSDIKVSSTSDDHGKVVVKSNDDNKVVRSDVKVTDKNDAYDKNIVKTDTKTNIDTKSVESDKNKTKCDYQDKTEQVTHSECMDVVGDEKVLKTKTELLKNSSQASETEKIDVEVKVVVKTESVKPAKVHADQNESDFSNIDDININEKRNDNAMKQIEAITEDLGNLIHEMRVLSTKTAVLKKGKDDTHNIKKDGNIEVKIEDVPANIIRDNVVLKKNKSESSLDSPDLEVSRLMNKKLTGSPFCDSSSSLEISGSSMESLAEPIHSRPMIIQESIESDTELDRRKPDRIALSTESSLESNTSEITPVNCGNFLNTSVSSNESVSPLIFGKAKKIHDSLSSLEASVSSLDSARHDKVMVTSADSGIEYSLQNPSENKDDTSSNEGTLTNNSSLKENDKKDSCLQDTLTSSPKRASSLLDVPAMKSKGLDRMRKISWVAPSSSFHIPKPEPEKIETKLPTNLEKLLSLFQHPTSLFSRSINEEEKKSALNTTPRKDSSLTSSFWSWGSVTEKDKDEKEDRDSSEATDSTLSERIQVSYVDESFSRKLDSKTPSTDTENTLSEFQSFPIQGNSENSDVSQAEKIDRVTEITTDNLVQKCLVVSVNCLEDASSNGNKDVRASDIIDLIKPNDLNKNWTGDSNKNSQEIEKETEKEEIKEPVRPRSFAAVLKSSGSENFLEKQTSLEGQPVDKLPSKVIRGIKENISPENTLTSSMTKTLAFELTERQVKNQPTVNTVWEVSLLEKGEMKAPIATIDETCDESADTVQLDFIDDLKFIDEKNTSADSGVTSLEGTEDKKFEKREQESVDLGKDALSYLIYESQDFEPETEHDVTNVAQEGSLAQELKEAEIKEKLLDLSPELVIDEAMEVPEVFVAKDLKGLRTSPVIPERAKLKKSNSMEEISQSEDSPKTKTIAFKIPETTPRDIPERRTKLRSRSGSSPKSLPESLNKPCPLLKMECKKKKKVSSLGKMAKDSLLALNMTEDEIAEFRRSYKLTSVESLRSLESVSEDANSQSGASVDSRCRACLRTSQESLMSLDSMTEDCKCTYEGKEKPGRALR